MKEDIIAKRSQQAKAGRKGFARVGCFTLLAEKSGRMTVFSPG
jgi:hypothetical protein